MANTKKKVVKKTKTAKKSTTQSAAAKPSEKETSDSTEALVTTIDRRETKDRRTNSTRREKTEPVKVERRKLERRAKVNRRRQIDPTTCERDYSEEEVEFMNALEEYKRSSGRMFPTCSEVLEVVRGLGYQKVTDGGPILASETTEPPTDEQQSEVELESELESEPLDLGDPARTNQHYPLTADL